VIYLAGYNVIGTLFTQDATVLELLHGVFWMVLITQPINAVAFAFDGIYKGMGNGRILRNVLLITTLGMFVPVILATDHFGWQLHAIWSAFLLWMAARGGLLAAAFERHFGAYAKH
jgi:Na+-driven multidrug efflux pump